MQFYSAFVDELSKIAEEDKKKKRSKTLISGLPLASHLGATGAMIGGLAAEGAGELSKHKHYGKGTRPKWSHPAKKWGRRFYRGGLLAAIPTSIMATREHFRRKREDQEKGK